MWNTVLLFILIAASLAGAYALLRTLWIYRQPVENLRLIKIAGYVSDGAMAFMMKEYQVLLPFVLITALFLWVGNVGLIKLQALSFLLGAVCSALAGFIGMRVATKANSRTTHAAQFGIGPALKISFAGGTVMGMTVVSLGLLGIMVLLWVLVLNFGSSATVLSETIMPVISGFSLGASSIALFARVGGGIFTKAADVGADLVGKVEAGIPEDDHRNPAVIADNVGDNVGDVAGMGADLFESFAGSLIGAMILGASMISLSEGMRLSLAALPLLMAGVGVIASIVGIFFVRIKKNGNPQAALNRGSFGAAILAAIGNFVLIQLFLGGSTVPTGFAALSAWISPLGSLNIYFATIAGLAGGIAIGLLTEAYTGTGKKAVENIVKACETGPATTLITGMGMGMMSTFAPVLVIGAAILISFAFAGVYGIAMAALGMLLTLGIQLAVDAYGPIADNAGGLAEMSEMPASVREVTDKLDAVGNTTAAIGKGFAIGSAALTALILFAAFQQSLGLDASLFNLINPLVMTGLLLGAVIPYLFSSLAMTAIGKSAFDMIEEVRRQFRERPGILNETEEPDYKRCIAISTSSALRKMILPGLIAALTPIIVGFLGGVEMLMGVLAGVTVSGVVLAIFMSNSGGAWDNAKKTIEARKGGKGSEAHKAAVVGDTVGDPFKDTAGPSINILIKLMAVVSLVIAPILKAFWHL